MDNTSGVGVLDKAAIVLSALEAGPSTLAQLVTATGLARPTAHRLAVALEHHRLVTRDLQGRFVLGPRLGELAAAAGEDRLLAAAGPVLGALRDHTNESAQLFRRQGEHRVCVSAAERPVGLRDSIPVGATLSMRAGSAAQVLLAWEEPDRLHRGLQGAAFTATALSGRPPPRLGAERRRARARRRVGLRAGALPLGPRHRRRVDLRADRAALPPARPAARRHGHRRRPTSSPRCSPATRRSRTCRTTPDAGIDDIGVSQHGCHTARARRNTGPAVCDHHRSGMPREEVAHVPQPRPAHRP